LNSVFCKHTIQKILKIQWGLNLLILPSGYAMRSPYLREGRERERRRGDGKRELRDPYLIS